MTTEPLDLAAIRTREQVAWIGDGYDANLNADLLRNSVNDVEPLIAEVERLAAAAAEAWDAGWESGATHVAAGEQGYPEDAEAHAKSTNPYRAALAGEGAADQQEGGNE